MKIHSGKSVNPMIAIGQVFVLEEKDAAAKKIKTESPEKELERLESAKMQAAQQLDVLYKKTAEDVGDEEAQIFEIHAMMLEDDDYNDTITEIITKEKVNAEYAVAVACEQFRDMLIATGDSYMQSREADIRDISDRLINCLTGRNLSDIVLPENSVICAPDLTPTQTMELDKSKICGFVTAYGSENSHAAILARTMNVPSLIGVGEEFLCDIENGNTVIVDGFSGRLIISPDEEETKKARQLIEEKEKETVRLRELIGKEDVTKSGKKISVFANIGTPQDLPKVLENDASGIGLFRSEFLYLGKDSFPTEEEQFLAYKQVFETMGNKKVIVRTLDIGADKKADYFNLDTEENPALGMRAIRLCLTRPEIFVTQLRAIYRASVYGNAAIMFPMITSLFEIKNALQYCDEAKRQLKEEGTPYNENVECGIMVETPAAAIISDVLAPEVDFFSIGTNDLTQYTLACDRQNPKLDEFSVSGHEAVLRLIETTIKNAHSHGKWAGICGELAGDLNIVERFVKMGVDELSVSPSRVLKLRQKIRQIQ
ncbi:MAG: phosphoenolpyruvate--protein phosphotransferase [Clostridia bacterium]|nr:phosphoenolpyruvate--protein phosphotransferase [Clostridia bacterium]